MRVLIYTQTVDTEDPVLGFFHRWLIEFSKRFERIEVVCLREGKHDLPQNVRVHTLGKESGKNRFKYIWNFYASLFHVSGSYDRVFVHMNPHYAILGGIFWRLGRIPVFFWRNHAKMNLMTRIAALFAQKVFYTSPYACTARFSHARRMPVGIDTELFTPGAKRTENGTKKILFLGRLSPVKKAEIFVEAAKFLPDDYELHLCGDDPTTGKKYEQTLHALATERVFFHPSVKNYQTPDVYRTHDMYVNVTPEGSMDKTVLEAVACGVPAVAANASFRDTLEDRFFIPEPTPQSLAEKIVEVASLRPDEQEAYTQIARENVVEKHSLRKLSSMLYAYMDQP